MSAWYAWQGNDLLLNVSIQPRARQDEISGVHGDSLKIRITAPPVDGRANAHLTAFLAGLCGVSKSAVIVTGGESSRHKRLRIRLQKPVLPEALAQFC